MLADCRSAANVWPARWAGQYQVGDVVCYSRGSEALKIDAGEYARVSHVDAKENRITIEREFPK